MNIRKVGNNRIIANLFPAALITCFTLLYACNSGNKQSDPQKAAPKVNPIQLLIGNGTNVFRNVSFGVDPATVKSSEKKAPDEIDTTYISYSLPLDTIHADSVNEEIDSLNYFTIVYNFDQQKLNEIDEDVLLANDTAASVLSSRLADYFTNKYGTPANGSDAMVWSFKHKGKKMKVTLSDQSEEYDYGKLSLVFYCEDF
jgi:hypothetical protein